MTEAQFRWLVDLVGVLRGEAEKCVEHGLYRPACLIDVSALELALAGQICIFEPELRARGDWGNRKPHRESPLAWSLFELLDTADMAGWFDAFHVAEDLTPDDFQELLRIVRYIRNLAAHPTALVRDFGLTHELGVSDYAIVKTAVDLVIAALTDALDSLKGRNDRE